MPDDVGGVNSADLAAEAVRDAMGNVTTEQPELDLNDPLAPTLEPVIERLEGEGEPAIQEPVTPVAPVEPTEPTAPVDDEVFMELMSMGIDFGVHKGELPPELHDAYDRLAASALGGVAAYQEEMNKLQMAQTEMKQFAAKLEADPQKVLLTMAVTKPEDFQQAVQAFEEMQVDERYKNMIIRELQAEAKLSAADRQQQVWQQRQMASKVQVVTTATHAAADRHGVDRELAERMVAVQIQANGGDIDPRAVDTVISSLRPRAPIAAAPSKVAAVAQAPTAPVAGQGTPTGNTGGVEDQASVGFTKVSRNPFMALVKDASRRLGGEQ